MLTNALKLFKTVLFCHTSA